MKPKEFFSRWKEGINKVTPVQQMSISFYSSFLIIIGILIGLYSTFATKTWWLFIVLLGSLFLTLISILSLYQKLSIYKKLEEEVKNEQQSTDGA